MKVLNIGSLNIDRVYGVDHFVKPGETIKTRTYAEACGGKGLNQSIALARSEEHTSELQSHSFISYAVFCLKKPKYDS